MIRHILIASLLVRGMTLVPVAAADSSTRPNVLFIAVDDLNHWVGHFNRNPQTKTPNIDRLANDSSLSDVKNTLAGFLPTINKPALRSERRAGPRGRRTRN